MQGINSAKIFLGNFLGCLIASLLISCAKDDNNLDTKPPSQQFLSSAIDPIINAKMAEVGASATTLAIFEQGKLVYSQAYGYRDANKTTPMPADALIRTGSTVKPITAAAIHNLARSGKLKLTDHAFCTGDNSPCWLSSALISPSSDPRAGSITVQQLLQHQGGFAQDSDPFGREYLCSDLNLPCPPSREDILAFMLSQPLDFTPGEPGTINGYSNFGYMVLGMIIEQASGMNYIDYVRTAVLNPIGITNQDFTAAHTPLNMRNPREPNYISTLQWPSIYHLGQDGAFADEGFIAQNWYAAAASLTTAQALAAFANHYSLPYGERLNTSPMQSGVHWGRIDGVSSLVRQLPNGTSYAVFINISMEFADFTQLQTQLDKIIQGY